MDKPDGPAPIISHDTMMVVVISLDALTSPHNGYSRRGFCHGSVRIRLATWRALERSMYQLPADIYEPARSKAASDLMIREKSLDYLKASSMDPMILRLRD